MNQSIGKPFPDFAMADQDGQLVKLSELAGKFPLIVSFYRGFW
jgi:peroxiredoxin